MPMVAPALLVAMMCGGHSRSEGTSRFELQPPDRVAVTVDPQGLPATPAAVATAGTAGFVPAGATSAFDEAYGLAVRRFVDEELMPADRAAAFRPAHGPLGDLAPSPEALALRAAFGHLF